jgi:hypothetical protein
MPGLVPYVRQGPTTYQVISTVLGGQLVQPDTGGAVKTALANSVTVLGVAVSDAGVRTSQDAQNPANIAQQPDYVAVIYGADMRVTYNSAVAFGQLLAADATGQVKLYVVQGGAFAAGAGAPELIVGRCTEPLGVAGAATVARARIGQLL